MFYVIRNKYTGTVLDKGDKMFVEAGDNHASEYLTVSSTQWYNGSNAYEIVEVPEDIYWQIAPNKHCFINGSLTEDPGWKAGERAIREAAVDQAMAELIDGGVL